MNAKSQLYEDEQEEEEEEEDEDDDDCILCAVVLLCKRWYTPALSKERDERCKHKYTHGYTYIV